DSLSELYTQVNTGLPIMLEHTQANPILQLIALDQITAHP
ncbi:MAG: hypothetical protein K0R94_1596, partial [Burkholderiales bacterium]|nr:hypothetical protein [Burkholderiales bacterium]